MSHRLTPHLLRTFLKTREFPGRCAEWPSVDAERIIAYGSFVGSVIEHHRALDRTMLRARSHIEEFERRGVSVANGTAILADTLTGSRGRFVRRWHAPEGGLWGSLIYISTLLPRYRTLVPLAVGIACCEAVREEGAGDAVIRWINDVLIDGRKVAGFLAESFTGAVSREEYCLLGFGVNVNNSAFPEELSTIATSLEKHLGRSIDLDEFGCCFFAKLCWNLGLLYHHEAVEMHGGTGEGEGGEHPLIRRWRELSDSTGRDVLYGFDVMQRPQYRARVVGVTGDGGLRLVLDSGDEVIEHSGEIRYVDSGSR